MAHPIQKVGARGKTNRMLPLAARGRLIPDKADCTKCGGDCLINNRMTSRGYYQDGDDKLCIGCAKKRNLI
jgi:hypothetical protein